MFETSIVHVADVAAVSPCRIRLAMSCKYAPNPYQGPTRVLLRTFMLFPSISTCHKT
jgi:hypothetical protein